MLTTVLVTGEAALARRVREALEGDGLSLAADAGPDRLKATLSAGRPDVVIVGGPLRPREGSVLRTVREVLPNTPIVACAPPNDARSIRWAIDSGADAVVWDRRVEDALAPTLRAVCAGQIVIPREARRQLQPPELTTREKQVLGLVVMGLSNGEIARNLYVTESTVKSHLGTAFRKLGVRSRAEAARVVADPVEGFGTGILAITGSGLSRTGRRG